MGSGADSACVWEGVPGPRCLRPETLRLWTDTHLTPPKVWRQRQATCELDPALRSAVPPPGDTTTCAGSSRQGGLVGLLLGRLSSPSALPLTTEAGEATRLRLWRQNRLGPGEPRAGARLLRPYRGKGGSWAAPRRPHLPPGRSQRDSTPRTLPKTDGLPTGPDATFTVPVSGTQPKKHISPHATIHANRKDRTSQTPAPRCERAAPDPAALPGETHRSRRGPGEAAASP